MINMYGKDARTAASGAHVRGYVPCCLIVAVYSGPSRARRCRGDLALAYLNRRVSGIVGHGGEPEFAGSASARRGDGFNDHDQRSTTRPTINDWIRAIKWIPSPDPCRTRREDAILRAIVAVETAKSTSTLRLSR